METRRTQEGLTRGMLSRWRLRAGAWQAACSHWGCTPRDTRAAPATRLGRSTLCGADAACDRAHHSPSEAGLSARRRRAAGGGARAHQVHGYDREAGPRPAHKSNFAHSHALHGPPSSIFHIRGGAYFHNHNASYS